MQPEAEVALVERFVDLVGRLQAELPQRKKRYGQRRRSS